MSGQSESHEPARRGTFVEHAAVYAAVGASAADDLLRFPPQGSTPFEDRLKLGSGAERFLAASNTLMTWGAQRSSGIEVIDIRQGSEDRYAGIVFDDEGTPEVSPEADVRYGPDGEAFLTAGTTASLSWRGGKVVRKMRVVYVTDETHRTGFALGTADDNGAIGETAYFVEHHEDDSVWAVARGFYVAPSNGLFGLKGRAAIRLAIRDAVQLLAALAPGGAKVRPANSEQPEAGDPVEDRAQSEAE